MYLHHDCSCLSLLLPSSFSIPCLCSCPNPLLVFCSKNGRPPMAYQLTIRLSTSPCISSDPSISLWSWLIYCLFILSWFLWFFPSHIFASKGFELGTLDERKYVHFCIFITSVNINFSKSNTCKSHNLWVAYWRVSGLKPYTHHQQQRK